MINGLTSVTEFLLNFASSLSCCGIILPYTVNIYYSHWLLKSGQAGSLAKSTGGTVRLRMLEEEVQSLKSRQPDGEQVRHTK